MKSRTPIAAVLVSLSLPFAAAAQGRQSSTSAVAPTTAPAALSIGGFLGYEADDLSGLSLRVDGEMPFQALGPQLNLSFVGSLGYSRLTDSEGAAGFEVEATANVIKILPAARFTFALNPQFSLFGDAGLGLYYVSMTVKSDTIFGTMEVDDSETSLMMRIGGGAWYQANERTRIGAMLELNPFFGDFDQTTFLVQAGVMFTM